MSTAADQKPTAEPHAHCTAAADGTLTWLLDLPPATAPRLILVRRHPAPGARAEDGELALDALPEPDGRWRAVQPPSPHLAEDRWDAWVTLDAGGERHRLRPGLRDLRRLTEGAARDRPSPVAVRIPYVTKNGRLAVRAWLRTAHAEAETVRVTGTTMAVRARLHGATTGEGAAAILRTRTGDTEHDLAPDGHAGPGIDFTVDLRTLSGDPPWDVFVRPRRGAPLIRVGRLLDDLADRRTISVYPAAPVPGGSLRPCFTTDNDLSIEPGGEG